MLNLFLPHPVAMNKLSAPIHKNGARIKPRARSAFSPSRNSNGVGRLKPRNLPENSAVCRPQAAAQQLRQIDKQDTAVVDITERERAARYQRQMADLVESSPDAIYGTDSRHVITSWNSGAQNVYGWSAKEMIGQSARGIVPKDRLGEMRQIWRLLRAGENIRQFETLRLRKDGSLIDISLSASPVHDPDGRFAGISMVARDISRHKRMQERLRQQTEELSKIMEAVPAVVWVANDPKCREVYGNDFAAALFHIESYTNVSPTPPPGIRPLPIRYFRNGRQLKPRELPMQRAAATGKPQPVEEIDFELPDGRMFTLLGSATPLFDERQKVRGVVAAFSDITARKKIEDNLRRSEERFRLIVKHAPVAMLMVNSDQEVVLANEPAERLFGFRNGELTGCHLGRLIPGPFGSERKKNIAFWQTRPKKLRMGARHGIFALRKDGRPVRIEIGLNPVRMAEGQFVMATILDMSERQKAQDVLRHANRMLGQKVRERTSQLLQLNATLRREVTNRTNLQNQVMDISEREQRRIGQDIHDGLGQQLTGIAMLADALQDKLKSKKLDETEDARRVTLLLQQARSQTRRLAHGLQPVVPDPDGLMLSLKELAESVTNLGVDCRFQCPAPVRLHDNLKATHMFRIAQEAVGNALRHAQCQKIRLSLSASNGSLCLQIYNDGRKFLIRTKTKSRGMGLQLMRFRSEAMGGTLQIHPLAPGGALIACMVPVTPNKSPKP
jgi:PAS domain S-box-containing protein